VKTIIYLCGAINKTKQNLKNLTEHDIANLPFIYFHVFRILQIERGSTSCVLFRYIIKIYVGCDQLALLSYFYKKDANPPSPPPPSDSTKMGIAIFVTLSVPY
jgi:hypothetical protein